MKGTAHVDFSVCICTYNRRESLIAALRSLERARVPAGLSLEVLVIDNNSSDGTAEALQGLDTGRLPLRYVHEARQGLSHARNRGVSEARGRVIAFLDDDVVVPGDWLENLTQAFRAEPPPAAVGGPAHVPADQPRPRWWSEELAGVAGHFDMGPSVLRSDEGHEGMIGIGANLAFDRETFERYGFFRSDLGRMGNSLEMGEELEFLDRLRGNGETLVYDPAIVVEHRPDRRRLSKPYLRRWYFRFGEWSYEEERPSRVVRWFRIPRWRFREALDETARWLYAVLARHPREAFIHQLHVVAFLGYLKRGWGRRPPVRELPDEPV